MKKSTIILLVLIILSVGIYFGINYFLDKDLEKQQQQLDDMIAEYGTIEKENISTAVAKFNTEIMNAGLENQAKEDANSTSEDKLYWYMIEDGIYCYAVSLSESQLKFYVNGQLESTASNTMGLICNNNLRLLSARYESQNASNIKMYNFMAYDRVLTDSEIQVNYNSISQIYNITT